MIKDKHQKILNQKINNELRLDLGVDVTVHTKTTEIDCGWCGWNSITKSSSGIPAPGRDWSTHANYVSDLVCPNCGGIGRIQQNTTKTIKCIEDDRKDFEFVEGKPARIDTGTRTLIGKYEDIKVGSDFVNNILNTAIKVVIDGSDYSIKQVRPIKLLEIFSFEAEVERLDMTGLPDSNVSSS